jgi:hypothetical protein
VVARHPGQRAETGIKGHPKKKGGRTLRAWRVARAVMEMYLLKLQPTPGVFFFLFQSVSGGTLVHGGRMAHVSFPRLRRTRLGIMAAEEGLMAAVKRAGRKPETQTDVGD